MTQQIESNKLLVKDIFKKWYRIPEYQRPYVWESDHIIELLNDVYLASQTNNESQYFLGSMVLKKTDRRSGGTQYEEYDILDGQQRITTLLLITGVIRDLTPKTNCVRIQTCKDTIFQMANPDDNIPERTRIVFDIRDKVRDFIDTYIKVDGGTQKIDELRSISQKENEDISIKNMANAILIIIDFFKNGNSVDEFFKFLRSNVLMIYVATEDLEDAFHLFTVMNNRGVKLRNSDILKAENLAKIVDRETRIKYAKLWENIEEYFAEDFDNFLSHLRTVLVKQKASQNLLKEYESNIYAPKEFDRNTKTYSDKPPLLTKGKSTFDFVEQYFKYYLDLFDNDNFELTNSFELYNQLALMRSGLEADFWIAPLLRYCAKYKMCELLNFLYLLDAKFSSDWIIGLSPTERIENINFIIKEVEATPNPDSLFASRAFKIDSTELRDILSGRIYGRRYCRYVLLKVDLAYHGHTTKFAPPGTISIEHILPQTPAPDSQWMRNFTEQDREDWTNSIGNLILLSRRKNSAQSNLDYVQKRDRYFNKNVELFSNSIRIFKTFTKWDLNDLKKNHQETLTRLLLSYGATTPT